MTNLKVEGMTCHHCVMAVTKALESVDGVKSAEVDLDHGSAVVDGEADLQAMIAAVQEEGYRASLQAG
ncbi:MAG TPA: heavy-metal-associated domain-containing protein [Trueperaceae bacterium]|nr:heavy-metal-associated domain-containing protein [Trueperaceae bacterium]